MRNVYLSGSSGILVSGIVWLIAGTLSMYASKQTGFIAFFIGGMLIHPTSILIAKLLKRKGKHLKENPLGHLAMESTVILFIGLFVVYSLFQTHSNWLFPIMLMIIGVRYLIFQSIYGLKIYWVLGLILIGAGCLGVSTNYTFSTFGIIGGLIEFIFSILIFKKDRAIHQGA